MFNNVFKGVVASQGRGLLFCPEYQNVLNYGALRGYTPPSTTQQVFQNALMQYITSSGLYRELDIFYAFTNNGSKEFSLINWIDTGSFHGTASGATPPNWDAATGWKGDGISAFIDTGYRPTGTAPQKFLQTDASAFIYSVPDIPITASLIGYGGTGTNTATFRVNQSNAATHRVMTNAATIGNIDFSGIGLKHVNSNGANRQTYINNGVLVSTQTLTSVGPATIQNITIFRSQNSYGNSYVSIFGLGGDTTSYSSSLNNAITTYLNSL
jgi:hypothetical protein